jgi:hypothetical protein
MPVLEVESSNYDLYTKRSRELAFRDRAGLETYMLDHLATDATGFFNNVRASVPPQEPATPFGEGRKDPVL